MSFCGRVKERLCAEIKRNINVFFGCGLLFLHAGRERSLLIKTELCDAVKSVRAFYEKETGEKLPVCENSKRAVDKTARSLVSYSFVEPKKVSREKILSVFGLWGIKDGELRLDERILFEVNARAFLRGLFVASGLAGDPRRGYHLEFYGLNALQADELARFLVNFDFCPFIVRRNENYSVYFKEADQLEYLLAFLGDNEGMFELSNDRIEKDLKNRLNRVINCDAANLVKAKASAERQIEDIKYILAAGVRLSGELEKTAQARLENEDLSLSELGRLLGIGRSGVNHRMQKISQTARELREKRM